MKKIYAIMLLIGGLAVVGCQTSKKEDPKPATTTGSTVSTATKATASTSATSTQKVSSTRTKTSKVTSKLNNKVKAGRIAFAAARMDSIPGDTTMGPPNGGFPGDTTGLPGDTTGMPGDTTGFPGGGFGSDSLDLSTIFSDTTLNSLEEEMAKEIGGAVTVSFSGTKMSITIDYGTAGTPNPAYADDNTLAKTLFGKLTMSVDIGGSDFGTNASFIGYAEHYDDAGLNSTLTGSFTDNAVFSTAPGDAFSSVSTMDLTITDSSGTIKIKGNATFTGTSAEMIDNSSLTITEGTNTFTYTSSNLKTPLSGCDNFFLPTSGTVTITDGNGTTTIDYGTGACDSKATVTTADSSEELDMAKLD